MKRGQHFLALLLLLFSGYASSENSLIEQVRHELQNDLYPLEKVAIGYERPSTTAPAFAIGEFRVDDDERRAWSQAIAEMLRWKIQYVPNVRLLMPPGYYTALDAKAATGAGRPLLTGQESFAALHKTLGIETVLTGSIGRDGEVFVLDIEMNGSASGENLAAQKWRATLDELPATLTSISAWVYRELGVELTQAEQAYLGDTRTLQPRAIAALVENYEALQASNLVERQDLINDLRKQHPEFSLLARYALHAKAYPTNLDEARENLVLGEQLRAEFPGHAGVVLESYRTMDITSQPRHEIAVRLTGLQELVAENPHDPMIMINLASALGDNGSTLEALAVILEAAERWPNHYRVWWTFGWLLNTHAWQIRGDRMWREVPEPAKERFKLLGFLSDKIVDEALALHDANADLWVMKLGSIGSRSGYSEELMDVFERAVAVAPTYEYIYGNALNFAENKWGGNASARRHIIQLAQENNPQAAWPEIMRTQHAADFEGFPAIADTVKDELGLDRILKHPDFWKVIFGLAGAAIFLFAYFSIKRSGKRRARAVNDFSQDGRWDDGSHYRELSQEEMLQRLKHGRRNH